MKKRVIAEPAEAAEDTLAESEVEGVRVVAPAPRRSGDDGYLLLGLLAGAVWGAVAGLLLAPGKGEEIRRQLLGQAGPAAPHPTAPAQARDAVAQVLQYTTPTAAEAAGQAGETAGATPPRAPGL
jgi:hypothetical protein